MRIARATASEWHEHATATLFRATTDWKAEIRTLFGQGKHSTFELAQAVSEAKEGLEHGEWTKLFRSGQIPFSKSKGAMLARIGKRFGTPNVQTFARLPAEWSILHQLARLDLPTIEDLTRKQRIHPDLTFSEARELVSGILGTRRPGSPRSKVCQRLRNLRDFLHETCAEWCPTDRHWVSGELRQLLDEFHEIPLSRTPAQIVPLHPTTSNFPIASVL
jgi:hypothetical protein